MYNVVNKKYTHVYKTDVIVYINDSMKIPLNS